MASIDLTPSRDLGTIAINVTTDGLTLTGLYRQDATSWVPSRPVRVDEGTFPTTNPPIIVDYEPALTGLIRYTATFADGPNLTYTLGDGWAAPDLTWLSVPLWPGQSVAVEMVTTYDSGRASGNVFHEIIDRVDPAVTLAPLRTRRGQLEIWCADYPATLTVTAVLDLSQVLQLRQTTHPGMDMYFTAAGDVATSHYPIERGMPTRWAVRVPFREVARPVGDLIENLGWSFDDVAAEFATFDQLPSVFATFDDLATNTRITP